MNDTHHHHVATSHVTSPLVLLLWRLSMLAFTSGVLYLQVSERGPRAFRFFTVWNWTAIIIYFLLASIASAVSVFGGEPETGRRRTRSTAKPRLVLTELSRRADFHPIFTFSSLFRLVRSFARSLVRSFSRSTRLSKAVATAFHALTPMTLYIDIITWTILVPALMKTPDLERRRHWENVMFSFISYAQQRSQRPHHGRRNAHQQHPPLGELVTRRCLHVERPLRAVGPVLLLHHRPSPLPHSSTFPSTRWRSGWRSCCSWRAPWAARFSSRGCSR